MGNKILTTESMRRVIGYLLLTQFIAIHIHPFNAFLFFFPLEKEKKKSKNNNDKQMRKGIDFESSRVIKPQNF